jgi:hypothetical protein
LVVLSQNSQGKIDLCLYDITLPHLPRRCITSFPFRSAWSATIDSEYNTLYAVLEDSGRKSVFIRYSLSDEHVDSVDDVSTRELLPFYFWVEKQ